MSGGLSREEQYWVALNMVAGIGKTLFYRLINHFHSAEDVFKASNRDLLQVEGVGKKTAEQIKDFDSVSRIEREQVLLDRLNAGVLTLNSARYPKLLKNIYDPPPVIYYQGAVPDTFPVSIAVVGTRLASSYGKIVTQRLCSQLASLGITLVSGMARGIDTLVHRTALDNGGTTVAIFGCGLDYTYPPENNKLREEIIGTGCVLTEFPVSTRPDRNNFPARNRVISGISLGTLVIEAGEKSGALITAEFALEQGREVFAVPGNITSEKCRGTNNLIRCGAKMVTSIDSILEELPDHALDTLSGKRGDSGISAESLNDREQKLMSFIGENEIQIDELILKSGLSPAEVSATLVELELKNLVRQTEGKKFINNQVEIS
ncbi:MAG: DNA-protecting protein DprA [Candidatus Nitronauta litoralis]|uniref:DNA-protecting protein DprA n=1 Tax=Candidatus Nitronauta litoralis TaxID=2705533 RepID=A0A7T0BYH9_9BACT|nr:MAG: DNA-protecting protein DprA [Candidatus Nitronauta litoralis]